MACRVFNFGTALLFCFAVVAFIPSMWGLETRRSAVTPLQGTTTTTQEATHHDLDDFSIALTWVNGSDANYMRHREIDCFRFHKLAWPTRGMCDPHWRLARVRTMGEILFNLRAIQKHLPWFKGTIFLVMDDWADPPSYFDFDEKTKLAKTFAAHAFVHPDNTGPRLQLMRHSEFIPAALLPTYSTHAIYPHLFRIPGIGKLFAQFDDDYIVGRPLPFEKFVAPLPARSPRLFFENNAISKSWCKDKKDKDMWHISMCRTLDAFLHLHPERVSQKQFFLKHSPMVYNMTVLANIVDGPNEIPGLAVSLRQKFRTGPTIQMDHVYAWHLLASGGVAAKNAYSERPDDVRLLMLNDKTGVERLAEELARFRDPSKVPMFLTINDDGWTLCEIGRLALQLLNEVLPTPSRWERQQVGDMAKVLTNDMKSAHQCRRKGEEPWKNLT